MKSMHSTQFDVISFFVHCPIEWDNWSTKQAIRGFSIKLIISAEFFFCAVYLFAGESYFVIVKMSHSA